MNNYILSCCSTVDLSKSHLDNKEIPYISFHYTMDDVDYVDDLGQTMSHEEFYNKMKQGATTKTSQVNVDEYLNFFRKFLNEGKDILHISLSSGISGSINSANIAKTMLAEEYPNRKIYIVDSLGASSGYGLLVDTAYDLKVSGYSLEDNVNWLNENKLNIHHWFYSTDLTYYVKGGRLTKAAGFIGGMINICPLLNMDNNGKLIPRFKPVGKKRAMRKMLEEMSKYIEDGSNYNGKCYISHADFIEDATELKNKIETNYPNLKNKVVINSIGTTIGSHTGPKTLALFFFGDRRND